MRADQQLHGAGHQVLTARDLRAVIRGARLVGNSSSGGLLSTGQRWLPGRKRPGPGRTANAPRWAGELVRSRYSYASGKGAPSKSVGGD